MAIATVTITGKVVRPDGAGVSGGNIAVTLSENGTVDDAGVEQVIGGTFNVVIATDGSVNFEIVPNSGTGSITPAGTSYTAVFETPGREGFTKIWTIAAAPAGQDIGDL